MLMLYLLAALILFVLLVCFAIYRFGFYTPVRSQKEHLFQENMPDPDPIHLKAVEMMRKLDGLPYEKVSTASFDGLRLCGRYYHTKDGAPVLIGFHGYRGTPSWDFSGGCPAYLGLGFNVLLIEERGHMSSEGHTITFGIKEKKDCLSWIRFVLDTFGPDTEIVLAGISMGAATVLMASGLELPSNVRGIIADCPYSSPSAIIKKVIAADMHLPVDAAFPLVRLAARLYGNFSLDDGGAVEAVRRTPVPVLLIHGEADTFVPTDMSREIAAANPGKIELHTFPGAGHGTSFVIDRDRYIRLVADFIDRVLPGFLTES